MISTTLLDGVIEQYVDPLSLLCNMAQISLQGTWQFMSAMILGDRSKVQGRVDDLEFFLHVLSWVGIRYVDNVMPDDDRSAHLKEVFHECAFRNNILSGGQQKRLRLSYGSYIPNTLAFKKPSPLLQLLKDIAEVFKWRYRRKIVNIMMTLSPLSSQALHDTSLIQRQILFTNTIQL